MGRVFLGLLLLGCNGARALVPPPPDAADDAVRSEGVEAGATAPDLPSFSVDLAVRPLPVSDAADPRDRPPADLGPDRPPPIDLGPAPKCEQLGIFNACVEAGDGKNYFRRRDGRQCGLCKLGRDGSVGSPAHCTMGDPDDTIVYCARSCFDCCHTLVGAPCQVAEDCCEPFTCEARQPDGPKMCLPRLLP